MIDVVSKNGIVLLNISPRADGSIPQEQQKVLLRMGDWLDTYGEAIYATKPWDLFGFGSGGAGDGSHGGQKLTVKYSSKDVRFTQSNDEKSLYMIFLGKPKVGEKRFFKLLAKHRYRPHTDIKRVSLLGSGKEVEYKFTDTGFTVFFPEDPMDDMATVVKIELE